MNSSANRSCEEAQLFGVQVLSDLVETIYRYVYLGYVCLLFPFSIMLTSFIIFLIFKFKHLRDTTFMLALQLAFMEWFSAITFTPVVISSIASGGWVLGYGMCVVIEAENQLFFQLRTWLMLVFVLDRFCTVFAPFRYKKSRKKIVLTLWLTTLVFNVSCVLLSSIMGCHGYNRIWGLCYAIPEFEYCPNFLFCNAYIIAINVIGQITGNYIPLIMYIILFIKAKKIRNQLTLAENPQEDDEQRKRDRRANLTFFAIFLSLFGVSFPPLIVYVIIQVILPTLGIQPPLALILISFALNYFIPLLPIVDSIIILRNPEMRRAIRMLKNRLMNRLPIKLSS